MARELEFLKSLVSNQWRALLLSKKSSSPLIFYLLVLLPFILYKYFEFLNSTIRFLADKQDNYHLTILFIINVAAWLVPIWSSKQITVQLKKNIFFPFNTESLFSIKLLSFFLLPTSIFALLFSALSFYPIFYAADFITSAVYAVTLVCVSILFDFAFVNLLTLRVARFALLGGGALVIALTSSRTFAGMTLAEINAFLNNFLSTFLFRNSLALNLILAFAAISFSLAVSFWSFRAVLREEIGDVSFTGKTRPNFSIFDRLKFSSKYGLLIKKDILAILRFSNAPYVSLLIALYYAYFINLSDANGYKSSSVLLSLIFAPQMGMFFNFFGLDTLSGIERCAVFPIQSSEIIKTKNFTALLVSASSLIVLLPVFFLKFSFFITLLFLSKWLILAAGYSCCGNALSVILPFNRKLSSAFPNEIIALYGAAFLTLSFMLVLTDSLSEENSSKTLLISILFLIFFAAAYFISLWTASRRLRHSWEKIRQALV